MTLISSSALEAISYSSSVFASFSNFDFKYYFKVTFFSFPKYLKSFIMVLVVFPLNSVSFMVRV